MKLNSFAARVCGVRVNITLLALAMAAMCLVGCGGGGSDAAEGDGSSMFDEALTAEELADDAGTAQAALEKSGPRPLPVSARAPNPAYRWNELALETARVNKLSDGQAARLYAMVNIAMYDAVNGIEACISARRASALVDTQGAPRGASLSAAASAAARTVLNSVAPARAALHDAQHADDLAVLRDGKARRDGVAWGTSVGNKVLAMRSDDGAVGAESQVGTTSSGRFRPTWNAQLRHLKPFGIRKTELYTNKRPPALNSPQYAAAFNDVKQAGNALHPDQQALDTFVFWASSSGTSQPAGEWVKLAQTLGQRERLSLPETTRLFALLGMALADVVAPTYTIKFNAQHWRPYTAILGAADDGNPATQADADWLPRGGGAVLDGSSPEYLSGHSSFAGAGTSILRGFFCEDEMRFTMQTDGSTTGARAYRSLSQAEAEAGRSRILGGYHFEFSNQDGQELGHGVADEVLSRSLLRTHGETHRHQHGNLKRCPK